MNGLQARGQALVERVSSGPALVPGRLRRGVLAVTILALGSLAGFGFDVRHTSGPVLFDRRVDASLIRREGRGFRLASILSQVGHPWIFVTITAAFAFVFILVRDYRAAAATVASVAIALVLVETVLKPFFDRHIPFVTAPTFPSGHTAVAVALAGAVTLAARGGRPLGRRLGPGRYLLMIFVLLVSCGVGLGMVVLQFHYMTDVVAGALFGLAVAGCTAVLLDEFAGRRPSPPVG